jgi:acetylornithine deacetylase/succinyl-diaminopimelate desuccinylase-like protein
MEQHLDVRRIIDERFDPQSVRRTAIELARTPCPQTELYEREPLILQAIRRFYRPRFEAAACDTWIDDYGNLIASQGSDAGGRHVMFLSYAMAWTEGTIPNPWSGEVMDGRPYGVDGEVVWGRGGSEYHPSNVAMLECARIVHDSGIEIPGRITYVVSSGGHTSSSDPVYHLVHNDRLRADLCITPGTREIVLGNMGRLDLRLNVYGKSVHSGGEIEVGLNAIEGGLTVINRLKAIMPYPPDGHADPDMGRGRLSMIGLGSYPFSPGFHQGVGSGGHTLQNLMRIMLDRRLPPGQDVQQAIEEIQAAVGDMAPWRVTFEPGALHYPWKHAPDAPVVRSVAKAHEVALGEAAQTRYIEFTIDAGYMNQAGIPTVMYGAMDMRYAHGDIEFTNLPETERITRVYTAWAIANSTVRGGPEDRGAARARSAHA